MKFAKIIIEVIYTKLFKRKKEEKMDIRYGRGTFQAPKEYVEYMNMIADSPCYDGLPNIREKNGKINWQCSSGKTTSFYKYFQARFDWWVKKADELGLPGVNNSDDRLTIAARMIHPTGKKVCLVCGKARYVGYMYLNAKLAKKWNNLINEDNVFEKTMPVYEAVEKLIGIIGLEATREQVLIAFPEKESNIHLFDSGDYENFFSKTQYMRSTMLSPGFMGDCPHRLDGMHDYCTFCRKQNDPGRSDENMRTYNHDRRAFMWWTEGDWMLADKLYNRASAGTCTNCGKHVEKISPDHVGPLSCGFKQNGFFEPLCDRCNSAKNRRFTFEDVKRLKDYENKTQESVASWQVDALWSSAKELVKNDADVKTLSNYMRAMQDYYLRILTYIAELGYYDFLSSFLHPEYAYFSIEFEGLDTSTLTYSSFKKTENKTNGSRSTAARSVRIAFDELFEYTSKTITQRKSLLLKTVDEYLSQDLPRIKDIFSSVQKNEIDVSMEEIISDTTLKPQSKDAKIQGIIEGDFFAHRKERNSNKINQIKDIISKRGKDFFTLLIKEL